MSVIAQSVLDAIALLGDEDQRILALVCDRIAAGDWPQREMQIAIPNGAAGLFDVALPLADGANAYPSPFQMRRLAGRIAAHLTKRDIATGDAGVTVWGLATDDPFYVPTDAQKRAAALSDARAATEAIPQIIGPSELARRAGRPPPVGSLEADRVLPTPSLPYSAGDGS